MTVIIYLLTLHLIWAEGQISLHCDISLYNFLAAEPAQIPKDGEHAHQKKAGNAIQHIQSYLFLLALALIFSWKVFSQHDEKDLAQRYYLIGTHLSKDRYFMQIILFYE